MAEIYSHTRLWLFEHCPEAYKIKYIDKKYPEIPPSINAFLGSIIHQSLEELYKRAMRGSVPELDDLIMSFAQRWNGQFFSQTRIPHYEKSEDYFNKGIKFLIDYYKTHKPFSDNTIEIEKRILFPLDSDGKYFIQGYIDRIALNEKGEYEVHDYKTNNSLKTQEEIDVDRQLAFYHIGLQNIFGRDIKVKLIWHFLAHNKIVLSMRTQTELDTLKERTLRLIRSIESYSNWRACGKKWCDWCEWKRIQGLGTFGKWEEPRFSKNTDLNRFL